MLDQLLNNIYSLSGLILLAIILIVGIPLLLYDLLKSQALKPIIITMLLIAAYRILWNIPLPGFAIHITGSGQNISNSKAIGFIGEFVTILSGGSFVTGSVLSLGLLPYGLAQMVANGIAFVRDLPLKMNERGGHEFLARWSMYLIIPFGILETLFLLFLLTPVCQPNIFEIFYRNQSLDIVFAVRTFAILIAGSMFALWVSELISEHGIKGQGYNLIIFTGVVGEISREFTSMQSGELSPWSARLLYAASMAGCILILIFLMKGKRNVHMEYIGKSSSYSDTRSLYSSLPMRVGLSSEGLVGSNLLLALSFVYLPTLTCGRTQWAQQFAYSIMSVLSTNIHLFGLVAFILVFLFTFITTNNQFMASYYVPRLMAAGASIRGIHNRDDQHYFLRKLKELLQSQTLLDWQLCQ